MECEDIKCCANYCESTANGEISFFRFPPDQERCDYWLTVIGREDLKELSCEDLSSNYFVCSLHFDESYLKEVDEALNEENIHADGDDSKEFLEVPSDDVGSFIVDESGNLVYVHGADFINVKSEDVKYEIQQEQGDIITMAISDDKNDNSVLVKDGDEMLSVINGPSPERKYFLNDDQVKVEKPDHISNEDLMMDEQIYGEVEEGEEEEEEEEEEELDEDGETKVCLCHSCGQSFLALSALRHHFTSGCPGLKGNETLNTFKCARCDMEFTMFDQMKLHIRKVHTQTKSYPCDVCGSTFGHRSNLSRHKLQHCSNKKFQCVQCSRGFSQRVSLISHHATVHGLVPKEMDLETANRYAAERIHRKPKKHKCRDCGKLFVSLTGLKNHDAIHRGHRPFICAICQKSFTLMSCLKTHMNTIHSDKKHYCELCGKSYQSEHYLKTHLRIHSGTKDHICQHCLKGFIDQPSLKLHMRTHTGEKPFTCQTCSRSFTQQSHLKTHMRIHTGEKPFKCDVCNKTFRQLSNVLEHQRTHKK